MFHSAADGISSPICPTPSSTAQPLRRSTCWGRPIHQPGRTLRPSRYNPRMKKLHLAYMKFTDPSVAEKLNSGCPALQDLSFNQSTLGSFKISSETLKTLSTTSCTYEGIEVSAPNTCSLKLGVAGNVQLHDMPSLVSAWVYVCPGGIQHLSRGGYDLVALLCNAQKLELLGFGSILQNIMGNSANEALPFNNLKSLVIEERQFTDFYNPFAYFLQFAPNLASLTFDQWTLNKWKVCRRRR
uniref:At1g61320/AtMIF1 LRR domain-containing protein n=1 Tax=Arundo donax TaxID=35708 RepID=A0A0A9GMP8_ARUDO